MKIRCNSYTEAGYQPIPGVRLDDTEYARALQRFVPACADIVVIDKKEQLFYLAARTSKPITGWWWIGGGIQAGMRKEEAAVVGFKRETGLTLSTERLVLVAVNDYRLKDRAQEPQDIGCHMLGYIFAVELSEEERASLMLDPNEYQSGSSLVGFNRHALVAANVFPAALDLYDDLFPS